MRSFAEKLEAVQQAQGSDLALIIAPRQSQLPLPIQRYDEPLLPFSKAVIDATRDLVCAYLFDLAAYMVMGAAGTVALERSIDYAADHITLLHGPFANPAFARITDELAFGADGLTLAPNENLDEYLYRTDRGMFLVSYRSANRLDSPSKGGIYWLADKLFTLSGTQGQPLQMRVAGESALYAGRGEDFAEALRTEVERLRDA